MPEEGRGGEKSKEIKEGGGYKFRQKEERHSW